MGGGERDRRRAARDAETDGRNKTFSFLPSVIPTVARGKARLRMTLTAAHTADEVDTLRALEQS